MGVPTPEERIGGEGVVCDESICLMGKWSSCGRSHTRRKNWRRGY